MIYRRFQTWRESLRAGYTAGWIAGLIICFLILIGLPTKLENLATFSLFLTIVLFGYRLGRKLSDQDFLHLLRNALLMGVTAAIVVFLLLALINRWQTKGINVKEKYFENITLQTTHVLTGIPESELFANPERDPITEEYPAGEPLRTDPMRLTFDKDQSIHLKLGLEGDPWLDINLSLGGVYGFMLLVIIAGTLSAALTWLAIHFEIARYWQQSKGGLQGNPILHWVMIVFPAVLFGLFWLSVVNDDNLGTNAQTVQLLLSFIVVIWALVSIRAAQPKTWGLNYPAQSAVCLGLVAVAVIIAISRIVAEENYLIAPISQPHGSQTLSILAVVAVGIAVTAYNALQLRNPLHFEKQIASTLAISTLLLLPLFMDQYQNDVVTKVGIYVILGLGLNIVLGYAGMLNLGYVAFFAIGAYAYAFLSSNQVDPDTQKLKFPGNDATVIRLTGWVTITIILATLAVFVGLYFWQQYQLSRKAQQSSVNLEPRSQMGITVLLAAVGIGVSLLVSVVLDNTGLYHRLFKNASPFLMGTLIGLLAAGVTGVLLSIPVLRLRGDYLAIVTLGFGEIIQDVINNQRDYTGGPQGVLLLPRPIPDDAKGAVTYLSLVYVAIFAAALTAFVSARLRQSRIGRAWNAMGGDEDIAQSMGVNKVRTKVMAFGIGAAFAGVGGVLMAARIGSIYPANFTLQESITVLSLIIIGGMGSIPGIVIGAIVLIGMPELLRELETYRYLVFGALLVAMVILRPQGLLPTPPAQLGNRARELARRFSQPQDGKAA